ncbi:hypothetical protein [Cloacibacillus evryensis]|uniref:portal protein n=1 Tax=Cloacibacillus evryensis TaxID=508460 RepID=UPI002B200A52|nr:hypothetical protein [Cloacibacillus evryensis]MEA5034231.1 hypothetical protein [Cloacibacillus evryensis]
MNREKVLEVVLADLARANDYFEETVEPKLLERRDIYLASKEYYAKKYPELAKKTDFRSFGFYSYIQWAKAPILDSIFGTSRVVHVVGCTPDDESAAGVMEQLIQWQVTQQSAGFQVCEQWIEDALLYELGILKLWWERNTETREYSGTFPYEQAEQIMNRQDVEVLEVGEPDYFGDIPIRFKQEFLLLNKAVFDNISPFDIRWSPEAKTLESANFVAQRQRVSASQLREGVVKYGYDKAAVNEVCENGGSVTPTTSETALNPELDNLTEEADPARRQYELYECYVNLDANDDGVLEPMVVTVVNNKVVRIVENGYGRIPFFMMCAHRDPAKVFATDISMADISGELQHLVVAMVRQVLINTSISNKPRKYIDTTKINVDDLIADRMFIRCSGEPTTAVVNEQPTQIAGWTMNFFELLKQFEEEWTGRTRYNQGMDASTLNKTATGITAIMKASNQRSNLNTKNIAEGGFRPMLKFLVMLNQRYMDQKQMIRVFGQALSVAPDDINGDLDVIVETDVGFEKRQATVNTLVQYLQQAWPTAVQLGVAGPAQFIAACVKSMELSGLTDARQYFYTEEEIRQNEQRKLEAAGAGGGGNAGQGAPPMPGAGGGYSPQQGMGAAEFPQG